MAGKEKTEAVVAAATETKATEAKSTLTAAQKRAVLSERMKAVERAGHMTPRMQRGFDRFNANIMNTEKETK